MSQPLTHIMLSHARWW